MSGTCFPVAETSLLPLPTLTLRPLHIVLLRTEFIINVGSICVIKPDMHMFEKMQTHLSRCRKTLRHIKTYGTWSNDVNRQPLTFLSPDTITMEMLKGLSSSGWKNVLWMEGWWQMESPCVRLEVILMVFWLLLFYRHGPLLSLSPIEILKLHYFIKADSFLEHFSHKDTNI